MPRQQFGALPLRRDADGAWQILLLTSRGRRLWGVPKGWPIRRLSPAETAAQEALEEAGVRGVIEPAPIGRYHYDKRVRGTLRTIAVDLFRLHVTEELDDWKERSERVRLWVGLAEAASLVSEPGLAVILTELAAA